MTAISYRRPWMYPAQEEAIFCEERYAVIEASTKSGKTVGCMAWLFEQAVQGSEGQNFWWVAPVYTQARMVFDRMKRAVPRGLFEDNKTDLAITLANGAVLWFKSADRPDSLYGEDVHAAVVDEATRCREEAWIALRTTLTATKGPVRVIGNVKGRKNWAYRLARRAESGAEGMHYAKITAWDAVEAGVLDADEIEDAKRELPEHAFRELYLAEPSDDGGNPFGVNEIRECIGPMSEDEPVAWGWDLAKSQDWTVGVALDEDGRVCDLHRFQKPWRDTIRTITAATEAPALVDSTGVGDPVLEELQAEGGRHFEGFKFTSGSKQQIMEGLAVAIQGGEITYPEGVIVQELETFEYEYTRTGARYTAPEGLHDDCVCALALAREMRARQGRGRKRVGVYFPGMDEEDE